MALTDLASSLRDQGIDIIGLAAGEPDFDTPDPIIRAGMEALETGITRYTPNTGVPKLRKKICEKLQEENGLQYEPDEIVVSNGAKQSVWQSILAVCSPGDEVVIPAPYWVSYPEMARLAGAEPVVVETNSAQGFLMTADQLKSALTPKSRVLILCSPSNPSGAVYSEAQLQEIANVVREHPRLLVLSDEIYEYIVYPPAKHVSFASLPGMFDRTLTVNGFSKAYAMTGWRLGYLAAPKIFAKACAIIQSQSTSGASSISQHAGIAALEMGRYGGQVVADMVAQFQERRDYVVKRLQSMGQFDVVEPTGAFYILPDIATLLSKGPYTEDFGPITSSDEFVKYLIEKANVATVPGDAFGAPTCIRISYAASMETLKEAMDRIETSVKNLQYENA
jgi:aspartate/glutamate/aspartate-prephenate aminotransferase